MRSDFSVNTVGEIFPQRDDGGGVISEHYDSNRPPTIKKERQEGTPLQGAHRPESSGLATGVKQMDK